MNVIDSSWLRGKVGDMRHAVGGPGAVPVQIIEPVDQFPTPMSLTPAPSEANLPENSRPGMTGSGRGSPDRVVQVRTWESSVWMTDAAGHRAPGAPVKGLRRE